MIDNGLLIKLRGVSFGYAPERRVLDGLDFEMRAGDRIGLVGSNGSGKTTLLHLLVGLLSPDAGEIEIFGQVRKEEKDFADVRTGMGLLFQDPEDQLFCPTVAEDVAFGPFNLGWSREAVERAVSETLAQLGLEGYADRITYKLSYGEKRLVSLATVLAMRPRALLLDEPTSGLDSAVLERITRILEGLDLPMLVVSHDDAFLQRVATSRVSMKEGRIEKTSSE